MSLFEAVTPVGFVWWTQALGILWTLFNLVHYNEHNNMDNIDGPYEYELWL
jgi:hypothetical protein